MQNLWKYTITSHETAQADSNVPFLISYDVKNHNNNIGTEAVKEDYLG